MTTLTRTILLAVACLTVPTMLCAEGFKRTEVKRSDLTGTNMEIVVAIVDAQPGAFLPKHIHPGDEAVYILEGGMTEVPGQAPTMLATGSSYINARDVPHAGYKVVGDKALKILTVHIVDKGKPITLLVPAP
jgi:quercetin dioxygenase-like cupin family protein